ncbi:MAG: hypothetical protein JWQ68_1370 [Cryobacterium sp.]|jgi:cell wall-associated NlpC family hydrolase|nr:hypothetical protein [Cryobacterium sp.]
MSMIDAMSRVGQIQSTLTQLSGLRTAPDSARSASAFAQILGGAGSSAVGNGSGAVTALGTTGTGTATGSDVVASAQKYLGVPYVFGGEDASGMDCSGLVQRVYADLGIEVPRLVSGQMTIGTEVGSLAEAKPGDLIVTGGGDHILIYAGDNKVIHAPYPGRQVSLVEAYMKDADITTIRRVVPDRATPPTAPMVAGTDLVSSALAALARGGAG